MKNDETSNGKWILWMIFVASSTMHNRLEWPRPKREEMLIILITLLALLIFVARGNTDHIIILIFYAGYEKSQPKWSYWYEHPHLDFSH